MIPPRRHQMNKGPMPGPGPVARRRLMIGRLNFKFLSQSKGFEKQLRACLLARWSGKHLVCESGPTSPLARNGLVVVSSYQENESLLATFIDHHRRLGAEEFVFLDLSHDGCLARRLASEAKIAVWRPRSGLDVSRVQHCLNFLRQRYATGRWCLSLNTVDKFVFYRSETRQIYDLIDFLESENRDHVFALVIETYGAEHTSSAACADELCYFDVYGYSIDGQQGSHRNVVVRGGLRRRTIFKTRPKESPVLSRIPLVKWGRFTAYVAGTEVLTPSEMNIPHSPWHSSPTACLLRPTVDSVFAISTLADVQDVAQQALNHNFSMHYSGSRCLVDSGLLNPGQWF